MELGPGIQHVVGGSHNSLVVEMKDSLVIVFDAPVSDWQSNWTLRRCDAKYLGKPVKYLVLTHHHMDHAGGLRAYASTGATLVVGKGTTEHYRRVLAAPYTRSPDLSPQDLPAPRSSRSRTSTRSSTGSARCRSTRSSPTRTRRAC